MFNSFRLRLFLSYLLVVGVCVAFIGLALLVFLRTNAGLERLDTIRITDTLRTVARSDPPPDTEDLAALNAYALRLAAESDMRIAFIDRRGRVVVDSDVLAGSAPEGDIAQIDLGAAAFDRGRARDSQRQVWVYVAAPGRQATYRLVALRPLTGPLAFLIENFLGPILQAACAGIMLSTLLSILIAYGLGNSLRRLTEAARAVARGNFEQRVPVSGPAEVRALAESFNDMVERVQASQHAQRDFIANVSHELKTPLTSIQGFSQAILERAASGAEAIDRAAAVINDEAGRMRRLVDGLLDLARLDAGQSALQRGPIDLASILRSAAEKLSLPAQEKNVALKVDLQPLPVVVADGDRMAQVVANLLDNAIKHTPGGGMVTLSARPGPGGASVIVGVADTGAGIPARDLPRIFERFYRVDKSRAAGRGYGLGLAIAREIVQAHGGAIRAESVEGLGTRFSLEFPVAQSDDSTVSRRRS
jgi:signal transduction histidine kinase